MHRNGKLPILLCTLAKYKKKREGLAFRANPIPYRFLFCQWLSAGVGERFDRVPEDLKTLRFFLWGKVAWQRKADEWALLERLRTPRCFFLGGSGIWIFVLIVSAIVFSLWITCWVYWQWLFCYFWVNLFIAKLTTKRSESGFCYIFRMIGSNFAFWANYFRHFYILPT